MKSKNRFSKSRNKIKIQSVEKECDICCGEKFVSSCCEAPIGYDEKRCSVCGRFAQKEYCCEGTYYLKVGDEVRIPVTVWSDDYLKKYFNYYPKLAINHVPNIKVFYGKIVEIIDENTLKVKVKYSRKKRRLVVDVKDVNIVK